MALEAMETGQLSLLKEVELSSRCSFIRFDGTSDVITNYLLMGALRCQKINGQGTPKYQT
jgi:hypothetical protein